MALADLHSVIRWPLYVLVCVHMLAALGYWIGKKENRIGPIFGNGELLLERDPELKLATKVRAAWVLAAASALVTLIALLGPIQ